MRFLGFFLILFSFLTIKGEPLYRLKGQGHFYRDFGKMDVERWLDKDHWLKTLKYTEKEKRLEIERNYDEPIGRVITCIGRCKLYRKNGFYELSYRSLIREGDTLETASGSYLWVAFINGDLMRLSSLTKIQLPEINISQKQIKLVMSLVHGFTHYISRKDDPNENRGGIDTDAVVFPLRYKEANLEYEYWRVRNKKTRKEPRHSLFNRFLQVKKPIDHLLGRFQKKVFLHTPHGDFMSENESFMVSFWPQKGVFWKHGFLKDTGLGVHVQLRKKQAFTETLASNHWYQVKKGEVEMKNQDFKKFLPEEFLMEKNLGVKLVRDHFFKTYFHKLLNAATEGGKFKTAKYGSRLWSEKEMAKREKYISRYYHFMGRKWLSHYEKGAYSWVEPPEKKLNDRAIKATLAILKEQKIKDQKFLRFFNKTQFHFWLHSQMAGHWYPRNIDEKIKTGVYKK